MFTHMRAFRNKFESLSFFSAQRRPSGVTAYGLVRLLRLDVTVLVFLSYLVGVRLVSLLSTQDWLLAAGAAMISCNFVYSFNAWSDWQIDRVNKPDRPIPSGLVSPRAAFRYAMVLLVLSVAYPFFVANSGLTLCLFLLLPGLGVLYSAKPFRLRRFAVPSVVVISLGLVIPTQLGYFMKTSDLIEVPFFLVLFVFYVSVVLLKDVEDVRGDVLFGIGNLFDKFGRRVLVFSTVGLLADVALVALLPIRLVLKRFMVVIIITSVVLMLVYRRRLERLYTAVIGAVVAEALVLFLLDYVNSTLFKIL
jgi:geranylgeranylglycerol-phosphate geranylgeranyltransferase